MSPRASPPPTTLHGHWLLFARVVWVVLATMALAIIVFSVPIDALSDDLMGVVRETMQPEHVTLWLRPYTGSTDRQAN
jgi:hypothetical protein